MIYECESCQGCVHKDKCIRGNDCKTPMEKQNKWLNVSKVMKQKRQETLERITTEYEPPPKAAAVHEQGARRIVSVRFTRKIRLSRSGFHRSGSAV